MRMDDSFDCVRHMEHRPASTTGSLCCVAARPHVSAVNSEGWSNGSRERHWRSSGACSPPSIDRRDLKAQPEEFAAATRTRNLHRASISSGSKGSRSNSRAGSAQFLGHRRSTSGGLFSRNGSPSESFRAPQWNPVQSLIDQTGDYITGVPGSNSSPSITIISSKEGYLSANFSAVSSTPATMPSSMVGEYSPALVQPSMSHCIPSSGHSKLSKSVFSVHSHPHLTRQTSGSQNHSGGSSQISEGKHEGKHSFRRSGSSGGESSVGSAGGMSDWWSVHTFSELVASSRRERLRWTSTNSPSDFGWGFTRDNLDRSGLIMERIQASGVQALVAPHTEGQACGICLRLLTGWSPWSSCRMVGNSDSTVVGVLVCGHVYHADCLELATPEARCQDPPCPQCWRVAEKTVQREVNDIESTTVARGACSKLTSVPGTLLSRNKLSRIGVALDDITGPNIGNSVLQPSVSEKPSLGKSMSMQHLTFRKTNPDLTAEALMKKPGASAQVSRGSASDDQFNHKQSAKLQSRSLRYLRRW